MSSNNELPFASHDHCEEIHADINNRPLVALRFSRVFFHQKDVKMESRLAGSNRNVQATTPKRVQVTWTLLRTRGGGNSPC